MFAPILSFEIIFISSSWTLEYSPYCRISCFLMHWCCVEKFREIKTRSLISLLSYCFASFSIILNNLRFSTEISFAFSFKYFLIGCYFCLRNFLVLDFLIIVYAKEIYVNSLLMINNANNFLICHKNPISQS